MKTRPIGEIFEFSKKFEEKRKFIVVADRLEEFGFKRCINCDLFINEFTTCVDSTRRNSILGECSKDKTSDGIGRIFKKV